MIRAIINLTKKIEKVFNQKFFSEAKRNSQNTVDAATIDSG